MNITHNYDDRHDVLYIGVADRTNSYGDELPDGTIVLRDADTNAVTGFTIFDFKKSQMGGKNT